MRKLIWILGLVAILPARPVRAQLADPGSVGVAMGHVHFAVQDMDAAKKFWLTVGGTPIKLGANEGVKFPGVLILIRKATAPVAGTVGSTVNHIGFLVPNVEQARARWKAAGLIMEPPNPANAKPPGRARPPVQPARGSWRRCGWVSSMAGRSMRL